VAYSLSMRGFKAAMSIVKSPLGKLVMANLREDEFLKFIFHVLFGELNKEILEIIRNID